MQRLVIFLILVLAVFITSTVTISKEVKKQLFELRGKTQGTSYVIKYVSSSPVINRVSIDSLFSVFDNSLSRYNPRSLLSQLNQSKSRSPIDFHLQQVLVKAISYQELTGGCFDYRLLPLIRLWGFDRKLINELPNDIRIKQKHDKVVSTKLFINNLKAYKSSKSLEVDIDGIAQGYCVDVLANFLVANGINDFLVELGGEVAVSGYDEDSLLWNIGIADRRYSDDQSTTTTVSREGRYAITTSGAFQQYRKLGNKLVSHILDPRTGYPVQNNIISVTVMAPTAIEADALDNAFMVMGVKETFVWIKKYPNIGVYITYLNENGEKADTANSYFSQFIVSEKKY